MPETTAKLQSGSASYPPAYNASGADLGRKYQRYIGARVRGDAALADLMRNGIDCVIDRTERLDALARMQLPPGGNCGESVPQANPDAGDDEVCSAEYDAGWCPKHRVFHPGGEA